MRVTIRVDGVEPHEIWNLTWAFQGTSYNDLPPQAAVKPTVTATGGLMGWESPAMTVTHAEALMREWEELRAEDEKSRVKNP